MSARPLPSFLVAAACACALVLAACGGDGASTATTAAAGGATTSFAAGGTTIPARTATTPPVPTTVTTPAGAPKIVQWDVPREFWCLKAHPGQAQVIVGWSAPSATRAAVLLDGKRVASGLRTQLPFWLPAGGPSGIGATVVFPCRGDRHRVTVRLSARGGPVTERTVTITKARGA